MVSGVRKPGESTCDGRFGGDARMFVGSPTSVVIGKEYLGIMSTQPSDSASRMTISVFGLGYVGCVSAACFASRGHSVIGVDSNPQKTAFIRQGTAPILEERIGELTADVVAAGHLTASEDPVSAVMASDMTIVCVGTPSAPNGGLSTTYLERATEQIGTALATKAGWHVIVYRSTMVPGTCERTLIPIIERTSGKRVGIDIGVCVNPEFLREGIQCARFPRPAEDCRG